MEPSISIETDSIFLLSRAPSCFEEGQPIENPPTPPVKRPPGRPRKVQQEESKSPAQQISPHQVRGSGPGGLMTDKEFERWEEKLKNEKNLKKRQRRFQEAELKLKEQQSGRD